MQRGDLVTVALQGDLGRPRPAIIVQSDPFEVTRALTVFFSPSRELSLPKW